MSFNQIKNKINSVRVSLLIIIFFLIFLIFSFSINFWIDVNNTKKYSNQARNNAVFQKSLFYYYNKLQEEKILIFTNLNISTKNKNIPSKVRKSIKLLAEEIKASFSLILNTNVSVKNNFFTEKDKNKLLKVYEEYEALKLKTTKTFRKVVSIHQQHSSSKARSKKENNSEKILDTWLLVSNKLSYTIIDLSFKSNFRPERLVRTIEDLQSLRHLLMRYKEFNSRQQTLLAGLIAIDIPISFEELQIINNYRQLNEELYRGIKEKLNRSDISSKINKNNLNISFLELINNKENYFNKNLLLMQKLISEASSWDKFSYNLESYLKIISDFNINLDNEIFRVNESIEKQSQNLYNSSTKKQLLASLILIVTSILAFISFIIITRRIIKPIENITSAMLELSKGDKSVHIPEINRGGEIGVMARAVESFKKESQNYSKSLEIEVEARTKELKAVNDLLTSSIDYASKIQNALLPQKHKLNYYCDDFFIYHDQRDIVGGDFFAIIEKQERIFVCVFDCAGHGVPGALLTMILGSSIQNIVKDNIESPSFFLTKLNNFFKEALSNTEGYEVSEDGLDALVLEIDKNNKSIRFSGAGIPLLKIDKNLGDKKILKGDKYGIGYSSTPNNYTFKNIDVKYDKGDHLFLASDGICDQIGGKGISFGNKRLLESLEKNKNLSMDKQKLAFIRSFKEYTGKNKRRDDITIIGVKV